MPGKGGGGGGGGAIYNLTECSLLLKTDFSSFIAHITGDQWR